MAAAVKAVRKKALHEENEEEKFAARTKITCKNYQKMA